MSQYQDLGVFGAVASNAQYEEIQHQANKTVEGAGHPRILSAPHGSDRHARNACSACPDEGSAPTREITVDRRWEEQALLGRVANKEDPKKLLPVASCETAFRYLLGTPSIRYTRRQRSRAADPTDVHAGELAGSEL
jgi:hypothetical protein